MPVPIIVGAAAAVAARLAAKKLAQEATKTALKKAAAVSAKKTAASAAVGASAVKSRPPLAAAKHVLPFTAASAVGASGYSGALAPRKTSGISGPGGKNVNPVYKESAGKKVLYEDTKAARRAAANQSTSILKQFGFK